MGYAFLAMASRRRARRRRKRGGWGRLVGIGLLVVLVLVLVGILGFAFWLRGYLRSPEFLARVNARVSEVLGAEARFREFRWEGMHVRAPLFEADGEELIRRIEAEEFETELDMGALVRRKFRSSDLVGRRLHVEVDAGKPAPLFPEPSDTFAFPGLKIESFSGSVDVGGPAWKWSGVRADVQPGSAEGSYDIHLTRGSMETPIRLLPYGELREARGRYFDGRFYLTRGEFEVYESGTLRLVGEVGFGEDDYTFDGDMRRVHCAEVVPEDWKKRVAGTLASNFTVQGEGEGSPVVDGSLLLHEGVLTALPVLDHLAAYADTTRFRRLVLSEARLDYRQVGKRLELSNVVLAAEGLTRLEGRMDIVDRRLDGVFRFGLAPGVLAHIPGAETKVFLPGEEGLLWTPLRITGTLDNPEQDLSKRMIAAAGARMFELAPETGIWVLKNSGRVAGDWARGMLNRTADPAGGERDVVGEGLDVVRDGVNGLFNLIPGGGGDPVPEERPELDEEPGTAD